MIVTLMFQQEQSVINHSQNIIRHQTETRDLGTGSSVFMNKNANTNTLLSTALSSKSGKKCYHKHIAILQSYHPNYPQHYHPNQEQKCYNHQYIAILQRYHPNHEQKCYNRKDIG